jgi:hypothetical protein
MRGNLRSIEQGRRIGEMSGEEIQREITASRRVAGPPTPRGLTSMRFGRGEMAMTEDERVARQVRLADEERQRRILAEKQASALRAANARLWEQLRMLAQDQRLVSQ